MTAAAARAPFLDLQSFVADELPPPAAAGPGPRSPFVSVYEFDGRAAVQAPEAPEHEAYAALVESLHDEEFDEALAGVHSHLRGLHQARLSQGASREDADRAVAQHFAPLVRQAEGLVDAMAREFAARDEHRIVESEVDGFVAAWAPSEALEPEFEEWLGKLGKKLGNALKGAAGKAWSGLRKVALGPMFAALRAVVRPILDRVLQKAIGRLPEPLQAPAQQLARKLGLAAPPPAPAPEPAGTADTTATTDAAAPVQDAAGAGAAGTQQELDEHFAAALLAPDEAELEAEAARVQQEAARGAPAVFANLDDARERLVAELEALEPGASAEPHIQQFLPAVLPALRLGLRVAGRKRVIDFLAQLLARLTAKLIGPEHAPALSRAIVDAGFKLLSLEVPEGGNDARRLAASAVAATVEETAARVAALPDAVLDSPELLEGFALEAFELAAAANLPPLFAPAVYRDRPQLLEGGVQAGWVLLPLRRGARYKRCTRSFKLRLTPYMAAEVESFAGAPLADHLQDQLGLPEGAEVEAELELYETLPGTSLSDITRGERERLGSALSDEANAAQLHPLTPQAASTLLGQPGLGRPLPAQNDAQRLAAGQRFYRLSIPGRHLLTVPGQPARARRLLHVRVVLDQVQRQIRVCVYLSEVKAQKLAERLRAAAHLGAVSANFRRWVGRRLERVLLGQAFGRLRAVHPGLRPGPVAPGAWAAVPAPARQALMGRLQEWLVLAFADFAKNQSAAIAAAAQDAADGVTLHFTVEQPPGLAELMQALAGNAAAAAGVADVLRGAAAPGVKVQVHAGHRCA